MTSPQDNPEFQPLPGDALVLTFPDDSSAPRDMALWAGVLALLTLIAYWPVTQGKFIWNDDRTVSQNRLLVHPEGLRKIWIDRWSDQARHPQPQYHPFADSVYWLQMQLFGGTSDGAVSPFGFHLTNLILAAGASVVLWLILHDLKVAGAWMAAAVFAVHPINTEAIAWISQLASVLAALLFFGSIYCFLRFTNEQEQAKALVPNDPATKWGFYAASVLLFVLAMLSKSTPFAMPFVVIMILWWKRRLTGQYTALLLPMVFIGVVLAFLAADFERALPGASEITLTTGQRLVLAGRAAWFYAGKLLLPVHLTFLYSKWSLDFNFVQFLPLIAIAALLIGLLILQKRLGRGPLVGVIAFGFCLLPALGFFNQLSMKLTYVADHYAYLASAALITLVIAIATCGLRQIKSPQARVNATIGLSALVLIVAGSMTWVRAGLFNENLTLWQDTVAKNPDSWFAHNRYAIALGATAEEQQAADNNDEYLKDNQLALEEARRAEALNPNDAETQSTIGRLFMKQKNLDQAIVHLSRATELDPNLYEAWQDLATALISERQYHAAITKLDEALRLAPQSSPVHRLLGEAYIGLGDMQRAAAEFRLALQYKPDNYAAREDYADLLARAGNIKEAKFQYTQILEIQKDRADIWDKVGVLSTAENNLQEAASYFKAALAIDPDNQEAKKHLDLANQMLQRQAATQATTRAVKK